MTDLLLHMTGLWLVAGLVSFGIWLTEKVSHILHFGLFGLFIFGAYLSHLHLLLSVAICALLNAIFYWFFVSGISQKARHKSGLLASLGFGTVVQGASLILFQAQVITPSDQFLVFVPILLFAVLWFAFWLLWSKNKYGRNLKAIADDAAGAISLGINAYVHETVLWLFIGGIVGLAGAAFQSQFVVSPSVGFDLFLAGFAAAIATCQIAFVPVLAFFILLITTALSWFNIIPVQLSLVVPLAFVFVTLFLQHKKA